jgi:hypothetical protein
VIILVEKLDIWQDHEGRIRVLEKVSVETSTKLNTTNNLLSAIAIMIGGAIITYLFTLL